VRLLRESGWLRCPSAVPAGRRPAIFGASFIDAQASVAPGEKKRHGCLTAYLILMIVANSALALVYLLASDTIRGNLRRSSEWVLPVLVVLALFNLVCAIALFRWKEWGFWGCCVSTIVGFLVNLAAGLGFSSRSWASPECPYYTACSILALRTRVDPTGIESRVHVACSTNGFETRRRRYGSLTARPDLIDSFAASMISATPRLISSAVMLQSLVVAEGVHHGGDGVAARAGAA